MERTATTRRVFLRGALGALLGAAGLAPGCGRGSGEAALQDPAVAWALQVYFGAVGFEVAARTGRMGIAVAEDPAALRREALALAEAVAGGDAQATVDAWRRQVREELAAAQVVSLANWQVAPTERRLYALAALADG